MRAKAMNSSAQLVVLDAFCGDTFSERGGFLGATLPTFPHCFHQTVLVWIPCVFLLIASPIIACQILANRAIELPWTPLLYAKLVLTGVLLLDSVVLLLISICESFMLSPPAAVNFVQPASLALSMVLMLVWILACRKFGKNTSGGLFLTWLLFAVCGLPELNWWILVLLDRSYYAANMAVTDLPRCACFFVWYSCVAVEVILFSFSDTPSDWHPLDREKVSPEETSSFLSRQTMWWFNGICSIGIKKPLEVSDLYSLNAGDTSAVLIPKWDRLWAKAVNGYNSKREQVFLKWRKREQIARQSEDAPVILAARGALAAPRIDFTAVEEQLAPEMPNPPSIIWRLFVLFKWEIIPAMLVRMVSDLLQFANPFLLKHLIQFTEMPQAPLWHGVALASAMFVASELSSLMLNYYFYLMYRVGTRVQTCLTAAVYKKALRLSSTARRDKTVGEIVNLVAVDIDRFQQLIPQSFQYWSCPLQVTIALYLLWNLLGVSVLSGVAVVIFILPINFIITLATRKWQVRQMTIKDERTSMISEILNGIKVIKLYAWEPPMEKVVTGLRDRELFCIEKGGLLRTVSDMLNSAAPFLVALSTFATFLFVDRSNVLTPQIAFVSLTLFNQLRAPLSTVAELISQTVQVVVSNRRLKEFLIAPELSVYINSTQKDSSTQERVVEMEEASLTWDIHEPPFLKNINIRVAEKNLVAIVGRVGSGKSSLLQSLLGEMERIQGRIAVHGRVAYVPQQAWLHNGSLRENVLFGHRFDEYFYGRVLDACELYADIAMLSNGDQTDVGEKGISLSGGQKARVGLARAVYQNYDVYLLDDPLSAVDAHVGAQLFHNVIGPGGILRNKTRIMVTNELSFLKYADNIIVLANGEIVAEGNYTELTANGAFKQILEECESEKRELARKLAAEEDEEQFSDDSMVADEDVLLNESPIIDQLLGSSHMSTISGILSRTRYSSTRAIRRRKRSVAKCAFSESSDEAGTPYCGGIAEHVETGRVKTAVYLEYFRAMSFYLFGAFVAGRGASTFISMARNVWLRDWSNENMLVAVGDAKPVGLRLLVYACLGLCEIILLLVGMLALLFGGVSASRNLHSPLFHRILRAPMQFFDTTPFGRILNRLGRDVETIDVLLPFDVQFFANCVLEVFSTLAIVVMSTPTFAVVVFPLALMYFFVLNYYLATSRQLKRLESITRSPIFSHLSESLQGTSTIRAFNSVERFSKLSEEKVDTHVQCRYLNFVSNRWLSIRLEFIGNCVVLFAALFAALTRHTTSAGVIGLSISYALNITFALNFAVRQISKLETNIVSVERVKEYSEMPSEASWTSPSWCKPPLGWPESGRIELRRYSTRYRPGLDLVLRRINVNILAHEKIGIVGRTGAGKSSVALALFRIIEPSDGAILIDGLDISQIGLHDLRRSLAIIPQDPVLFSGTLRFNLDPMGSYTDMELWLALKFAHLEEFVESQPNKLEHLIIEGGENMSVGERQLVCLARALLRKSKVLVLDEATAAVDISTDALIQKTIRREFRDSTVLTIAHRLNTILDYDRIIVLDKGKIAEFDSPASLLMDHKSIFYAMACSAGLLADEGHGFQRRSRRGNT
uniref:Multidrug resistance-associated protein 1 n=1 Tax=Ascaris suum TaxID=6253 RepID=F1KQC8_ASCSU